MSDNLTSEKLMSENINNIIVNDTTCDQTKLLNILNNNNNNNNNSSFVKLTIQKIYNNKLYICIAVIILLLGIVLYYLKIKTNKKINEKPSLCNNNKSTIKKSTNDSVVQNNLNLLSTQKNMPTMCESNMLQQQIYRQKIFDKQNNLQSKQKQQNNHKDNLKQNKLCTRVKVKVKVKEQEQEQEQDQEQNQDQEQDQEQNQDQEQEQEQEQDQDQDQDQDQEQYHQQDQQQHQDQLLESDSSEHHDLSDITIKLYEDDNVSQHNLTKTELHEINQKLASMNKDKL